MKIAALFLLCFVSATWQQNIYWSFSPRRVPFYSLFDHNSQTNGPILPKSDAAGLQIYPENRFDNQPHGQEVEQRTLERPLGNDAYQRLRANFDPRLFGFMGNVMLNSLKLFSTITSFTTETSTITIATMYNCFNSSIFKPNPPPCRRKRDILSMILIGDNDGDYSTTSIINGNTEEIVAVEVLPKEGQNIDPVHLVKSSFNEEGAPMQYKTVPKQSSIDRYIRQNRNFGVSVTITSTVTSYSVYYSTSSRTFSDNFSGPEVLLNCVPPGMNLC